MSNESMPICPQCGATLKASAPAGLCPNCLMALNLKTETVFTDDPPAAQPPLPPEQIAPHFPQLEILECLGRGGMGVVYKARQKTLNRLVALKLLAPERVRDAKFAERFAREAQALAALNHPNIVTIYDFGQAGGFYFLLMEFVDGVNLRQLLRARKFAPEEALAIVPPLCDALQFAHDRGIVHRDIKPENLLLDKAGRVKVADFGIAKILGPGNGGGPAGESVVPETATQTTVGTPGYSAPEQWSDPSRVDSRADIYSLGVVFYEMLTGELPGKQLQPPSKKVQIDVRLDEVVLRALEQKPELRYQQASALKTEVETIATTPPRSSGRESARTDSAGKPSRALPYRRAAKVAVWVWLLVFLAATVVTFILPESFSSTARIKIEPDQTDIEGLAGNRMNLGYDPFFIQTEFEAIQSEIVLGKVVDLLDLNTVWGAKTGGGMKLKTTDTIGLLKGRMALRPVRNTSLIEVTVYSEDRTEAAKIANAIAESYRDLRIKDRTQQAAGGISALEARYKEQQDKIHKAQKELDELRDSLKISDAEAKGNGPIPLLEGESLRRITAMKIEGEARLVSLQASVAKLKALSKDELRVVVPRYRPDARLDALLNQLSLAEQFSESLQQDYAKDHPNVKRAQTQIEKVKREVDENVAGIMTAIEVELAFAQAQVDELNKAIQAALKTDQENSQKSRPYFEKKRALEELVNFGRILNLKLSAERIDLALPKTTLVEIMDYAQAGVKPVRPNRPLNLVLGAVLGMVLGLVSGALTLLTTAFTRKPKTSMT